MVNLSENVQNASKGIFDAKEPLDYVVCAYVDKANVDVVQSGTGGMNNVKEILTAEYSDKVAMGAFAVTAVGKYIVLYWTFLEVIVCFNSLIWTYYNVLNVRFRSY